MKVIPPIVVTPSTFSPFSALNLVSKPAASAAVIRVSVTDLVKTDHGGVPGVMGDLEFVVDGQPLSRLRTLDPFTTIYQDTPEVFKWLQEVVELIKSGDADINSPRSRAYLEKRLAYPFLIAATPKFAAQSEKVSISEQEVISTAAKLAEFNAELDAIYDADPVYRLAKWLGADGDFTRDSAEEARLHRRWCVLVDEIALEEVEPAPNRDVAAKLLGAEMRSRNQHATEYFDSAVIPFFDTGMESLKYAKKGRQLLVQGSADLPAACWAVAREALKNDRGTAIALLKADSFWSSRATSSLFKLIREKEHTLPIRRIFSGAQAMSDADLARSFLDALGGMEFFLCLGMSASLMHKISSLALMVTTPASCYSRPDVELETLHIDVMRPILNHVLNNRKLWDRGVREMLRGYIAMSHESLVEALCAREDLIVGMQKDMAALMDKMDGVVPITPHKQATAPVTPERVVSPPTPVDMVVRPKSEKPSAELLATRKEADDLRRAADQLEAALEEQRSMNQMLRAIIDGESADQADAMSNRPVRPLEEFRGVFVGGHEIFHNKLRKAIPGIRIVHPDVSQVDLSIFDQADYVAFYTGYSNHRLFQQTYKAAKKRARHVLYVEHVNIPLLIQTLCTELGASAGPVRVTAEPSAVVADVH